MEEYWKDVILAWILRLKGKLGIKEKRRIIEKTIQYIKKELPPNIKQLLNNLLDSGLLDTFTAFWEIKNYHVQSMHLENM